MPYRPLVSEQYAEQIRRWHERSYAASVKEGRGEQVFEYLGRTIAVPPDLQPITRMSHLLGQAVLDAVRASDRVLDSDVFGAVAGAFDLIVFDPQFRWFAPRSVLEATTTDEDYTALTRFFAEVDEHLAPGGRVLLFFGTSGDIEYVRRLSARFDTEVLATERLTGDGWDVDYFTFRPRPR